MTILETVKSITEGETDLIANCANVSAVLYQMLPDVNWCGFYFLRDAELVLGPFQGKPACIRIALGRGVCGTAAATRATQVVPNVHDFPGHIACDADSNSEVVVPLVVGDQVIGVLDVDSPLINRFSEADVAMLEAVAAVVIQRRTK